MKVLLFLYIYWIGPLNLVDFQASLTSDGYEESISIKRADISD